MRLWKPFLITLVAAIVVAGCTPAEKPPEEPEAPPPPTAEEIQREITGPVMPLVQSYNLPWREFKQIPEGQPSAALEQVRAARARHIAGENGEEGIRRSADFIEAQLRSAYETEAWPLTTFLYNALRTVMPQRADNYTPFFDRAMVFLNMPRPTVTGFFVQGSAPVVFIDVLIPSSGQVDRVQVREGEEFHGLVLVEIKGNNRGAIIEHMETGEIIDLDYGPRATR
jgi:hypothetical protein